MELTIFNIKIFINSYVSEKEIYLVNTTHLPLQQDYKVVGFVKNSETAKYLLENPNILIEHVNKMRAKNEY